MPATYKPRSFQVDAGAYCLDVHVSDSGAVSVAVLHVSPGLGLRTVAYLAGFAESQPNATLVSFTDAHDATNGAKIAPGGGKPTEPYRYHETAAGRAS